MNGSEKHTDPTVHDVIDQLTTLRNWLERYRDEKIARTNPRGRHFSLAITAIEEAEMRLLRAEEM